MSSTTTLPLVGGKPGQVIVSGPTADGPLLALTELVPVGNGLYRPIVRLIPAWQINTPDNLKRLGVTLSTDSMLRLIAAGFVKSNRPTPQVVEFDYYSYLDHQRASADPEFWDRKEPGQVISNRNRYRAMWDRSIVKS